MEREVEVESDGALLRAILGVPYEARGIVAFAHGSGSSRFSPRNRFVAEELGRAGFATLLMDLLTEREERADMLTGAYRFDVELLARRLLAATAWTLRNSETERLPLGYFGASTGAAAALIAAARAGDAVRAVVSRGGRPDLAGGALPQVTAATLLIVGGADTEVIALNRTAERALRCPHELVVIDGASHLFEEPGALEAVARHAAAWFGRYLEPSRPGEKA